MPSLATRIFERYEFLFQRADIRELLPDVLTSLKQPDTQALLRPSMIKLVAENPDLLRVIVPEIDNRFIGLLKEDPEVNTLINDPDLHVLLQNPADIDELAVLLDLATVAIVGIVPTSIESPDVGDGFSVELTASKTEDTEVVEPTPTDTEDDGTVESTPEGIEDTEIVERSTPAWDVNEDRFVNILDLVLVTSNFGAEGPVPADVNGDNTVNILDLTLVASHLGEYYEEP